MAHRWWILGLACALAFGCGSNGSNRSDSGSDAAQAGSPKDPDVGCNRDLAVLTHLAGGESTAAPSQGPRACAVHTDLPAAPDTVIVVNQDGDLLVSPGPDNTLARSRDNGKTWQPIDGPKLTGLRIHHWLHRDAASGRVFFNSFDNTNGEAECENKTGTALWWSDDFGSHWERHTAGCDSKDFGKIVTGPAVTEASKQALAESDYPSIVYFCSEGPTLYVGPNRECFRSLDGGKTFERTAKDAVKGQVAWPQAGAIGPDGTIFIAHGSGVAAKTGVGVVTSHDEGDSWTDQYIPDAESAVNNLKIVLPDPAYYPPTLPYLSINSAVDEDGTVYVAWVDDRDLSPYIAYSRDQALSWSKPIQVGAPGVEVSVNVNLAVSKPGHVAFVYFGSKDADYIGGDGYTTSDGRRYDAYLGVTTNLFAAKPVFSTARLNAEAEPVLNGMSYPTGGEYLGAPAFGPDGSVWAAFVDHSAKHVLVGRLASP